MITRRKLVKSGLLAAGGTAVLPYLAAGEVPPVSPVINRRLQFSPFYSEYIPDSSMVLAPLKARLNSNENPYGPSAAAIAAVQANAGAGNLYSWKGVEDLTRLIAEKEGVATDQVLIGPGSTDFLEKAGMLFFSQGGELVSADPTFMTIIRTAQAVGADWKGIPLGATWSYDLSAMESAINARTKMVYLCNPNNPTGTLTDADELIAFGRRVSDRVPVFADEAYLDFLPSGARSYTELLKEGRNVLVARTFSKIYGLAGLRIGYLLGKKETLARIADCSFTGMGISNTSIAAAMASLQDESFVLSCREKNSEVREYTFESLKKKGYSPVKSHTSFMIFPIETPGREFSDSMYAQGIGIRTLRIQDRDWCRVSIGTREAMDVFLEGLDNV